MNGFIACSYVRLVWRASPSFLLAHAKEKSLAKVTSVRFWTSGLLEFIAKFQCSLWWCECANATNGSRKRSRKALAWQKSFGHAATLD